MVKILAGSALMAALPLAFLVLAVWIRRVRGDGAWRVRAFATLIGLAAAVIPAVGAYQATGEPAKDRLYLVSPLVFFLAGLIFTPRRRTPRPVYELSRGRGRDLGRAA